MGHSHKVWIAAPSPRPPQTWRRGFLMDRLAPRFHSPSPWCCNVQMVGRAHRCRSWALRPCSALYATQRHNAAPQRVTQQAIKCRSLLAFVKCTLGAERLMTCISYVWPVHIWLSAVHLYGMCRVTSIWNHEEQMLLHYQRSGQSGVVALSIEACVHHACPPPLSYCTVFSWQHETGMQLGFHVL